MDILKQYNKIGKNYLQAQAQFFKDTNDIGTIFIKKNLPKKAKVLSVLDFGCGSGRNLKLFQQLGFKKIYGVDTSKVMIKVAKKNHPELAANLLVNNIEKTPFENKSFDVVSGRFALHYLRDFNKAYKEINRILKPNGVLIFVVDHPLRDLMVSKAKKYGHQEIIKIHLYHHKVTLCFPSHTFRDYFSKTFFQYFQVNYIEEGLTPDQGKADRNNTPDYLAVVATKKRP